MLAPEHRHEYICLLSKLSRNSKRTVDFDLQYPKLEKFIAKRWEKAFQLVRDAKKHQMQYNKKIIKTSLKSPLLSHIIILYFISIIFMYGNMII